MPEPLVSILINNYNYGRYLSAASQSALTQRYRHVEVIVVDDGSTDDSQEVITSFAGRVVSGLKINGGQPSAYNSGFNVSRGDITCFLDADDWLLPEKAARVVEAFANREYGWFFHLLSPNGNDEAPSGPWLSPRRLGLPRPNGCWAWISVRADRQFWSMFPARIAGTYSSNA